MSKAAEIEPIDDEIELVTDDEPIASPPEIVTAPAAEAKPEPEKDDVDEAVAALKKQVEDERLLRVAAENKAADHATDAANVRKELTSFRSREHENQFNLVVSQLDAVTKDADNIQAQLAQAFANGDYEKASGLQRQLSRLESRADQLEQGRDALEARKIVAPDENAQPIKTTESLDPVGDAINKLNISFVEKTWLNKHPDVVTDSKKWQSLIAIASYAINAKGFAAGTPEYFSFIENELGYAKPSAVMPKPEEREAPAPRQTERKTYSAPPSREASPMNGQKQNGSKIRLSPEQREAAKASGLSDAEYAKNLINLGKTDASIAKTIQYVN